MKIDNGALTIFPTELAKRRFEKMRAIEAGALSTSALLTGTKLMSLCERAARSTGLLQGRIPGPAETVLLRNEAAETARKQFAAGQPLSRLSSSALADVLRQTLDTLAVFASDAETINTWLCAHEPAHKLTGIGQLLTSWRNLCNQKEIADRFTVNIALLHLIESGTLPAELNGTLHFRAVRWLNPFEERLIVALKRRLGPDRVKVYSVLPDAHADITGTRLKTAIYSELERGAEEQWTPWLEDFADAFEMDDSNIPESDACNRVFFFESAHPYGEIEDAARRIAREIETGSDPDEIALILRDLSPYTDIIPDVLQRYGIPYHFRRGTPAAACPPVKTLLALLAFSQTRSRDRLCDLLLNPAITWPDLSMDARRKRAQDIRKNEPPRLLQVPKELHIFQPSETPEQFAAIAQKLMAQHDLTLPEEVLVLLNEIATVRSRPLPPEQWVDFFEKLLSNITLNDPADTESGIWVVNPMDASGLRFDSVYIAGMDDRSFPQTPKPNTLLNKTDRRQLRAFLEQRGIACPRLTLSESGEALIQEEILFLTAISNARERLTLSYTRMDADGKERAPGEFFKRMRELAGNPPASLGASFHSILPPYLCRAQDEVRQTAAKLLLNPNLSAGPRPVTPIPSIQKWLKKNTEFSATSLECLARSRYVFFLEKILNLRPDQTHEDDTNPMDRGSLLHSALEKIYTAIAAQSGRWAVRTPTGWELAKSGDIQLAVMDPSKADELLAMARSMASREFEQAESLSGQHLGRRGIWETEKRKLLQIVENVIRTDLDTALDENRYPALFEMQFGAKAGRPVVLEQNDEQIPLKGKIDRIDLIFNDAGELEQLLVADYKGKSRGVSTNQLEKEVERNLDCQLPVYTFAAQQIFFGMHNTPELNEKVRAVYHVQERDVDKMKRQLKNKRLEMTPELSEAFLEELFSNVRKLRAGDLATEPLIAGYEDYSHICRTTAIDAKDLM